MNMSTNFGTKPKSGISDNLKINNEKQKPISEKSVSLADAKLGKYSVNFVSPIVSVDLPNHKFINKFASADAIMKKQIQHIIGMNGKTITPNRVPLSLDDKVDTVLYSAKTSKTKKDRFNATLSMYGIINDLGEVKKYPYQSKKMKGSINSIRIICFKQDYDINIILLDIHHLLASDDEVSNNYDAKVSICKTCISTLI